MIYNNSFVPNLLCLLSAFIVLGIIVATLSYYSSKGHARFIRNYENAFALNPVPLATAAMVLGIGLGGFIDGVVFHQILQWHEMLTNQLPPDTVEAKSVNMFWDGIFHAFTFIVILTGIILLWRLMHRREIDRTGLTLTGGLVTGWGLFNIVEGTINHHILNIHNVREDVDTDLWNYGFLGISVLMLAGGYLLLRRKRGQNI